MVMMFNMQLWKAQLLILVVFGANLCFGCITTNPQQVTRYVGQRLTYTCEANCGEIFWKINNAPVAEREYPYQAVINEGFLTSTLTVEASAVTNNSIVICLVFEYPNTIESPSVSIVVQGTTEKPANLLFNYDVNNVNLSWSQPYILPDTELIGYEVTVSTERNVSLFTTTDTRLSFPYNMLDLDHDPCALNQSVNISVAGVNQVGVGEPATIEAFIVQSPAENCTQAVIPRGAPMNVTVTAFMTSVAENNSVIVSWQPPPLTLPSDIFGYKLIINISSAQDLMTQSVFSNDTFFTIFLNSLFSRTCDREFLFEISVTTIDSVNRESDSVLIVSEIASSEPCSTATESVSEEISKPHTLTTIEATVTARPAIFAISTDAVVISASIASAVIIQLAIGGLIILLLIIRKRRINSKSSQGSTTTRNSAYGVSCSFKNRNANGSDFEKEEPHHYEEICIPTSQKGYGYTHSCISITVV